MSREDPDLPLVERIQGGNEKAFNDLMGRYKRPILNFIYRLVGDATEADDLAQEVFVRTYRNLRTFRPGTAQFSTWLFQLAHNASIDCLRKRARRPVDPVEPATLAEAAATSTSPPDHETEIREIGERIATAVAELPEDQRTAFVLAEYHGMSYAEIAEIMRCSEKSVESRLYRAKQSLRTRLGDLV
jgi:RNA polymerase sigma-70 factor, ECF subfamily